MQATLIPRQVASEVEPWSEGADADELLKQDSGENCDSGEDQSQPEHREACALRKRFDRAVIGFRQVVSNSSVEELRESIGAIRQRLAASSSDLPTAVTTTVVCSEMPDIHELTV